jgi:hypothetical protein
MTYVGALLTPCSRIPARVATVSAFLTVGSWIPEAVLDRGCVARQIDYVRFWEQYRV